MENKIPSFLYQENQPEYGKKSAGKLKNSFIDKTILSAARTVKTIYIQAEHATSKSPVHRIHPAVKLFSLLYLAVMISFAGSLKALLVMTFFLFLFYLMAGLRISAVYRQIFILAFVFGFLIVLPASLNVITPGSMVFPLVTFDHPLDFWIYHIPQQVGFTAEGLQVVFMIFLRVMNSITLAMLIVYTTFFPSLIKSLGMIGVPDTFLLIIYQAYKFIFILAETIEETYFAIKSRLVYNIRNKKIRSLVGGRLFFIFKRAVMIHEETYFAMISRGYQGKVLLLSQNGFVLYDYIAMMIVIILGVGILLI